MEEKSRTTPLGMSLVPLVYKIKNKSLDDNVITGISLTFLFLKISTYSWCIKVSV